MTNPDPYENLIVTTADLRTCPSYNGRPGFCARGARLWFARYGLDWTKFAREGIEARKLLDTGDAMGQRLVEHALGRRS